MVGKSAGGRLAQDARLDLLEAERMALPVAAEPIPFTMGADGVARVGGTRVTLDTVVRAFKRRASPDEIVASYDTLQPADVYAAIAYYLRHEAEVEAYLREREDRAEAVRATLEAATDRQEIRARLRGRQAERRSST